MKKKLLSLVLAGAMVASTSVSAFADSDKPISVGVGEKEHTVKVTGNVTDNNNTVVPGTINVSIPTAVAFTVNSQGKIDSANINITSDSEESIDVIAYKFIDPSENSKITVVSESDLASKKDETSNANRYVSLSITGGIKEVVLKSTDKTKTGIFKENGTEAYELNEKPVIGTVSRGNDLNLTIEGKAAKPDNGYQAPTTPIRDDFQLILKLKRTR